MKRQSNRPERIASKVQTLVAGILRTHYGDDPILGAVSIVGADARGGGQFVRLYFYCGDIAPDVAARRLGEVTRTIRFELAHEMNQKYVPEIRFEYDDTAQRSEYIDKLLDSIK